jgi:hypothetical protein
MLMDRGNGARPQIMPIEIILEAGGDHQFDLAYLRRQGAIRLVRLLLYVAGYRAALTWRIRVEKKIACGAEMRPITVVGAKPWCCYLKIKPGDNNTGHFCSLLMPNSYRGEVIYDALKAVEDEVNRAWREGAEEVQLMEEHETPASVESQRQVAARQVAEMLLGPPAADTAVEVSLTTPSTQGGPTEGTASTTAPSPSLETPPAEEEPPQDQGTNIESESEIGSNRLLGWTKDEDKVRLTLLAIHELCREGKDTNLALFVAALSDKLGWEGLRRTQTGAIFAHLKRRGYIYKRLRGTIPLGYALTDAGRAFIHDLLPTGEAPPSGTATVSVPLASAGPTGLASALADLAQKYAAASQKLEENRARRAKLAAEIAQLDKEAAELGQVVEDPEIKELLQRLVKLTGERGVVLKD